MTDAVAFRIGDHVRLIGTGRTGRVEGFQRGNLLRVIEDVSGDYLVYAAERWEVIP